MRRAGYTNLFCHRAFPPSGFLLLGPAARGGGDASEREGWGCAEGMACETDSLCSPAPSRGGESERHPSPANVSKRRSEYREFVATLSVGSCDSSSQMLNQAHANQMIDMSGAVIPGSPATGVCRWGGIITLASELPVRAAETEIPARSLQPRNQRRPTSARSVSIAGNVRFARLCVLIEPNPARRSVHQDLDRILHLHPCCAPRLLIVLSRISLMQLNPKVAIGARHL